MQEGIQAFRESEDSHALSRKLIPRLNYLDKRSPLPLQPSGLRPLLHHQGAPQDPPNEPSDRQAALLPPLPCQLLAEITLADTHPEASGRQTVPVRHLQQTIYRERQPKCSHEESHDEHARERGVFWSTRRWHQKQGDWWTKDSVKYTVARYVNEFSTFRG